MNRSRGVVFFDNGKSIAATRLSRPFVEGAMATVNPYRPAAEEPSTTASRPHFIVRPVFVLSWIAGWCALSTSLIFMIDLAWPIPLVDRGFYFRLYGSIGAASGLLSWFTARLVALSRLKLGTLVILLLPLAFVFLLAVQLNPVVAALTAIIAGTTLALSWFAQYRVSEWTRPDNEIDEPSVATEAAS
ncbi:hypothetical protein Mal15_31260 [Stieleria maiorica]|uniref:Uncharacterized protein n=1 Tax=Stieleria maiorica TaxID=2795974 RepID=A0A5B9MJ58_9BACT|nr:hypothetical protein [Stieleria maiorica]QEF99067.1 hypothetical protein Mal15_31260 [Stieleria maiorica]